MTYYVVETDPNGKGLWVSNPIERRSSAQHLCDVMNSNAQKLSFFHVAESWGEAF